MLKSMRKFRWFFFLLGLLLMLFVLGKLMAVRTDNKVTQCVADFQEFEPSRRTMVMRLYGRLYFPNDELNTEDFAGEYLPTGFTVKQESILWARFEKKDNAKNMHQRFAVYRSDLQGDNATEVFFMEGEFYDCSAAYGTRDAFLFSYCKEKNRDETKQILKYDINTNSVSTVNTGQGLLLHQAAGQQQTCEREKDLWDVKEQGDTFEIIRREDGTKITTVERNFWKGTIYETAFEKKHITAITAETWSDTVIFSAWISYGLIPSYVTVSFAYDPLMEQWEFLSCIEPYEYEWFDILLLD